MFPLWTTSRPRPVPRLGHRSIYRTTGERCSSDLSPNARTPKPTHDHALPFGRSLPRDPNIDGECRERTGRVQQERDRKTRRRGLNSPFLIPTHLMQWGTLSPWIYLRAELRINPRKGHVPLRVATYASHHTNLVHHTRGKGQDSIMRTSQFATIRNFHMGSAPPLFLGNK